MSPYAPSAPYISRINDGGAYIETANFLEKPQTFSVWNNLELSRTVKVIALFRWSRHATALPNAGDVINTQSSIIYDDDDGRRTETSSQVAQRRTDNLSTKLAQTNKNSYTIRTVQFYKYT